VLEGMVARDGIEPPTPLGGVAEALFLASLSAVSEAPYTPFHNRSSPPWALRIQRLEGSRPSGLWELYAVERVLIARKRATAVRVVGM
jgi:hypothetical protein